MIDAARHAREKVEILRFNLARYEARGALWADDAVRVRNEITRLEADPEGVRLPQTHQEIEAHQQALEIARDGGARRDAEIYARWAGLQLSLMFQHVTEGAFIAARHAQNQARIAADRAEMSASCLPSYPKE